MTQPHSTKIQGFEVLSFEGVELTCTKGDENFFVDLGNLLVLYFQENIRFILNLNEWSYCLLKRLSVTSSSRTNMRQRIYTLPSEDGYYILKISNIPHPEAIQNFETILDHCTTFSYQEEQEELIEDQVNQINGEFEIQDETSPKKRNGRYSEEAEAAFHPLSTAEKIKRGFTNMAEALSRTFIKGEEENVNLTSVKDFESLKAVDPRFLTRYEFSRHELESAAMRSRDFFFRSSVQVSESITNSSSSSVSRNVQIIETKNTFDLKEEQKIIREIEWLRRKQEKARMKQETYKEKEYEYRLKERELCDFLQEKRSETEITEINHSEQAFHEEIAQREKLLIEQQEIIEIERRDFEQREKELIEEIEKRMGELMTKEKLTEEERLEYDKREQALVKIQQTKSSQSLEIEKKYKKMIQEYEQREIEIKRRQSLTREQREELSRKEWTMRKTIEDELYALRKKEELTVEERKSLKRKQKELTKLVKLREAEVKKFHEEQKKIQFNVDQEYKRIMQRVKLTEEEREEFRKKELQYAKIMEERLAEIEKKEKVYATERAAFEARKMELTILTDLMETEKKELNHTKQTMNFELREYEKDVEFNETLIISERAHLEGITNDLMRLTEKTEKKWAAFEQFKENVTSEIRRREMLVQQAEALVRGAKMHFQRQQEDIEMQIAMRQTRMEETKRMLIERRETMTRREEELVRMTLVEKVTSAMIREEIAAIKQQKEKLSQQGEQMLIDEEHTQRRIDELHRKLMADVTKVVIETEKTVSQEKVQELKAEMESIQTLETLEQDLKIVGQIQAQEIKAAVTSTRALEKDMGLLNRNQAQTMQRDFDHTFEQDLTTIG